MKKIAAMLISNGNLKEKILNIMDLVGLGTIFATAYFFEKWEGWLFWLLMLSGAAIAKVSAYGGLAEKFGYKPFTNDPLGWRKAKESYLNKDTEEELKPSVDASAEDLKK